LVYIKKKALGQWLNLKGGEGFSNLWTQFSSGPRPRALFSNLKRPLRNEAVLYENFENLHIFFKVIKIISACK
jgi:hypothetical protein